jgi:hypothetical protein
MKLLKALCVSAFVLSATTACAGNQAAQDYYIAMQAAQESASRAQEAKYLALSQMASSSDPGAATAAVMAIALSQDKVIAPQYVESSALKWAQVLTPAVSTLGLGAIQAAVSMNASDNSKDIQMASFATNEAIQLGQQNMVTNLGGSWADAAATAGGGAIEVALAGFDALNTAGGQTADVAIAGFGANTDIATAGFDTVGDVATAGMSGIVLTAANGLTTANNIATTGFTTVDSVATTGMTNMTTIAQLGMEGMFNINQDTNATMAGIIADNNATSLANNTLTSTNYSQVLADLNATIQQLGADLATPITCQDDGTGTIVCN